MEDQILEEDQEVEHLDYQVSVYLEDLPLEFSILPMEENEFLKIFQLSLSSFEFLVSFEKDDEVGVIFQSILKVQEILNEFNLRKTN